MADGEDTNGWTDDELKACLVCYLEMLGRELAGELNNKSEVNRVLREGPLHARSKGSVEFRMQNISSFMIERGKPYIAGYKPRANVGATVLGRLASLYDQLGDPEPADFSPTDDPSDLRKRAARLQKASFGSAPVGNSSPAQSVATLSRFCRSPAVVAYVIAESGGMCECCGRAAPFLTSGGVPFLEVHHVKPLAEGGPDTVDNAVAVCPNCHRACHHAADKAAIRDALIKSVPRLVPH